MTPAMVNYRALQLAIQRYATHPHVKDKQILDSAGAYANFIYTNEPDNSVKESGNE